MLDTAFADLQVLAQALLALALGGLVGWEREAAGKGAGFRTNMLVCFAAFLFVKVGFLVALAAADAMPDATMIRADPVRVVEAVVTGVAFIGAGIIFRDPKGREPRGLTTAATLFAVAPVGIAVAIGHYALAFGATVLIVFVLRVLGRFEQRILDEDKA